MQLLSGRLALLRLVSSGKMGDMRHVRSSFPVKDSSDVTSQYMNTIRKGYSSNYGPLCMGRRVGTLDKPDHRTESSPILYDVLFCFGATIGM